MKINFEKLKMHQPKIKMTSSGATIGSILRWQRKKRNLTLHEGSDGICSISYLSKVENNLIEPSDEILKNLKRRLDLEEFIDYDLKKYEDIYDDIIDTLFNFKNITSMYHTLYKNNQDYKSKLIIYAYHIDNKSLDRAKKLYYNLEQEISKFDLKELNLFFFLTALLLKHEGKYYDATKIINFNKFDDETNQIATLSKSLKCSLLLRLNRVIQAQDLYYEISTHLIIKEHFEQYKKLKYEFLMFTLSEYDYQTSYNLIEKLKNYSRTEKQFLELMLNTVHKRSDRNNKYFTNIEKDELWYSMVLINFDINEDWIAISNAFKLEFNFVKSETTKNLEFFLTQKYTIDHEAFLRYIRIFYKNISERFNGVLFIDLLLTSAANFFEKQAFYKTSNGIRKYQKIITKKLKMTLD